MQATWRVMEDRLLPKNTVFEIVIAVPRRGPFVIVVVSATAMLRAEQCHAVPRHNPR